MGVTLQAWLLSLQNMLAPGVLFTRHPDAVLTRLLTAFASMFLAAQLKFDALMREADPRLASSMLPDWERTLGLPDECVTRRTMTFAPGRHAVGSAEMVSFSRASPATYFDAAGVLQTAGVNAPRFDHDPVTLAPLDLLIEVDRTNIIRNNTMVGAAVGTPGTLPTNWVYSLGGGIAQEIVGVGTVNGINYIDVRCYGTAASTSGRILSMEANTISTAGFTWTTSAWVALVGGSLNGVSSFTMRSAAEVVGTVFTPNAVLTRYVNVRTLAGISVAPVIRWNALNTVTPIDFTLRIGMPQQELGASVSSVIPTSTVAVTRAADLCEVFVPLTSEERRRAAFQRLTEQGGQSRAYFTGLAELLGEPNTTITEFKRFTVNSGANDALYSQNDRFVWRVNVPTGAIGLRRFNCNSACNFALQKYTPSVIECALRERKPAHTNVIFAYAA